MSPKQVQIAQLKVGSFLLNPQWPNLLAMSLPTLPPVLPLALSLLPLEKNLSLILDCTIFFTVRYLFSKKVIQLFIPLNNLILKKLYNKVIVLYKIDN